MALVQRKKQQDGTKLGNATLSTNNDNDNAAPKRGYNVLHKIAIALLLTPVLYYTSISMKASDRMSWKIKGEDYGVHVDFDTSDDGTSNNLGLHKVIVATSCKNPQIWTRVVGDALVNIPLSEEEPKRWVGSFTLPMEGSYKLESRWQGCDGKGKKETKYYEFNASGTPTSASIPKTSDLFADGAWIASGKVKISDEGIKPSSEYIWANSAKAIQGKEMTPLQVGTSIIMKESVATDENAFYRFGELSNYEVVCWIGSKSAADIRGAFLALRPQISPHQRPFKFHYYEATNFVKPDTTWLETPLKYFRKCKHILVSLDEPDEALSQLEYKNQVTTFLKHLVNAFNEESTFPALIWMFTNNESPIGAKNCHSPVLKRTTNHPCNDALKDIFKDSPFPSRVRLLDNTDLSSPKLDEGREDIVAAVALRIFVFVGKQVKAWRDAGQIGGVAGLTRNGKTEPNYALMPYDWTTVLSDQK